MSEQISMEFMDLFENDKVRVRIIMGETRVEFLHKGKMAFIVTHKGTEINIMGAESITIMPRVGNVIDVHTEGE